MNLFAFSKKVVRKLPKIHCLGLYRAVRRFLAINCHTPLTKPVQIKDFDSEVSFIEKRFFSVAINNFEAVL